MSKKFSFGKFGKLKDKLDDGLDLAEAGLAKLGDKLDERAERNDPIYSKKLHDTSSDIKIENGVWVKGGIDVYFLLIVIALTLFGAVMAYSASSIYAQQYHDDSTYFAKKHILYLIVGIVPTVLCVIFARPWTWRFVGVVSYVASVLMLLLVLIIGSSYGSGATRWIQIGPISIQPSEVAKMAVILVLALFMSKHEQRLKVHQRFGGHFYYGVLGPMLIFGFICVLVMLEKHLSGIIIIALLGMTVMYLGGTDLKWFALIFGVGAVAVALILMVSDYAWARVDTWLNIESVDPLGGAWQTLQGLYAIGSGGFFGVGLGNSRQKFGYVSQPQNDFIFTIVCEELGFIGALIVIILFALLVWRGFYIASHAPDKFCALTVYGLTAKVALQAILNIAVVTNSMPNTGISLPFFSSGGTSLIMQIFEMGIILSISRYSYQKR